MSKKYYSGVTSGFETDKTVDLRKARKTVGSNLWAQSGVEVNSKAF